MAGRSALGRVLSQPAARLFFLGSLTSWTGLWMQRITTEWLAWELTHSPLWVGVLAFCNLAPSVIVSPLAGAAADRMDRVRLTMASQFGSAAHAAVLVVLILTGLIRVEAMAVLEVFLGTAQCFSQPARQTLIAGIVPRPDLPGAVALNSLCYNLARFAGPAVAGPMIAAWGVIPAIAANCAAYVFASLTLPALRLPPEIRRGNSGRSGMWRDVWEGVAYVVAHPGMAPLFAFAAMVGVLMRAVPEMLPPFVGQLFHRGAPGLATLASTMGLFALAGGLLVASRGRLAGLSAVALAGGLLLVLGTAGFVATGSFPFAVACAAVMGAATTIHGVAVQTLLQSACAESMLGRVLSLYGMITRAAPALGALAYGAASEGLGLQVPVLLGCAACVAGWGHARQRLPRMAHSLEGAGAA